LYYKIYVGEAKFALDTLISQVLLKVVDSVGPRSWFYIRYFDEHGPHLRLRMNVSERNANAASNSAELLIAAALRELPRSAQGDYTPMIAPGTLGAGWSATRKQFSIGLRPATYEPEQEIYGANEILAIAHRVFQKSSELAVAVLVGERDGRMSRKSLAPSFMEASRQALLLGEPADGLWREYALYWLGSSGSTVDAWRATFTTKAASLIRDSVSILPESNSLPYETKSLLEDWKSCLTAARAEYDRANVNHEALERLQFNFCHLMNNRLGINVLEEAYLGTLLEVLHLQGQLA